MAILVLSQFLFHFSLFKVIRQKAKFNIEYLISRSYLGVRHYICDHDNTWQGGVHNKLPKKIISHFNAPFKLQHMTL